MAIVTYNDNGTIKVVKFGTRVVSTDADPIVQYEFYEVSVGDYNHAPHTINLNIPQDANGDNVMAALESQQPAYYADLTYFYEVGVVVKGNEDGLGYSYWKLRHPVVTVLKFYKVSSGDYNQADVKVQLNIPEYANGDDVMAALENQAPSYYADLDGSYESGLVVRGNEDGLGNTYWKLRPEAV